MWILWYSAKSIPWYFLKTEHWFKQNMFNACPNFEKDKTCVICWCLWCYSSIIIRVFLANSCWAVMPTFNEQINKVKLQFWLGKTVSLVLKILCLSCLFNEKHPLFSNAGDQEWRSFSIAVPAIISIHLNCVFLY